MQVNVIPVIGKADLLTPTELANFKSRINEQIKSYGLELYTFPNMADPDDSVVEPKVYIDSTPCTTTKAFFF